jgi:predicted flap endonuclease-1-like 5' DNA nuclease
MVYDISILWFWLALAFALGAAFGYRNETDEPQEASQGTSQAPSWWRQGWFYNGLKAWAFLVFLALIHVPGGKLGLWIEAAVLLYAAYILGCLAGGVWFRREKEKKAGAGVGASAGSPGAAAGVPSSAPPSATSFADPPQIAAVEGEENFEGRRPVGFVAARSGKADDLQRIKGIGPQNEERLHKLGIWHFAQIAAWTPENVQWVGGYLSFAGRIEREQWIAQASALAAG